MLEINPNVNKRKYSTNSPYSTFPHISTVKPCKRGTFIMYIICQPPMCVVYFYGRKTLPSVSLSKECVEAVTDVQIFEDTTQTASSQKYCYWHVYKQNNNNNNGM